MAKSKVAAAKSQARKRKRKSAKAKREAPALDWHKRCKRDETMCAHRRTWRTYDGEFKVEESDLKYGKGTDRRGNLLGYPIIYRAMCHKRWGWDILSYHRTQSAATKACEVYANSGNHSKGEEM